MIPFKNKNQSMEQFLSNPHIARMMSQVTEEEKPQVMQMLHRIFAAGESMNMMVSAAVSNPAVVEHINNKVNKDSGSGS